MKVPVAPCAVSSVVPVTGINSTLIDVNNYELKGGLFKDVQYAWMSRGPFFTIVEVETGKRIASHCFCSTTADLHTEVMCVVELTGSEGSNKMSHCVLGIRCDVTRDMLCVFDINFSRVLRAINMPSRVLSLCVVEEGEIRYPISKTLWVMSGIIAVGLQDGLVLLVDLAKHEWEKLSSLWHTDYYDQVRGEQDPCSLLPLGVNEEVPNLEWKKSVARQSGAHLSLFLNGNAFIADEFLLLGPGGHTRKLLPKREVAVTSLMYIRRSISLVIGFSMSSFQIWNLSNLSLSYTSSLMVDPLPVVHLGFQEPSDDPRNFCYLWAVHSSTAESSGTRGPLAYMYALFFKSKDWLDGYGYLYRDFQSCRLRLEYIMPTLDCGKKKVVASRCVSYQTLNSISQRNVLEPEYDDSASENDLCAFVWEVYGSEGETKATRLSLFDLNQWYKDQMPSCVEDDDDDDSLNPCYLVTFSLADIWKCKSPGPLLDVRIDPHNVQLFKSFQSHEEYFQPSALSFISRSLLGEKIVSVTHPGVQRFILSKMDEEGPLVLLDPKLLFENCFKVGLRPLLVELPVNINIISEVEMRHYLLSVALENGKQDFLHHCAKQWANGSHSKAGCTLHMLVDWSYHRASVLKTHAHSLCEPLFNHSGDRLDKNQRAILDNCILQLHHLSTLFQTIMECTQNYSSKEFLEEIDAVARALKLVDMYFAVLQWFLNGGLLPEFPEDSVVDNYDEERNSPEFVLQNIPYPVTALRRIYQRRRKELEDVSSMCGESLPLFIDSLLSHESPEGVARVAELWCSDGGDDSYPPPSLQSLLQTYLIEGISIHVKHAVVIYLFLDLAALLDRERYRDAIDYFIKFPSAMCMSPSNIKIIQAFYLLDQGNFEEALDMILDPLVSSTEVQPWQHTYMVRALMSQRQHTKALEYCEHNLPDVRLKITLLVIIGQVSEAHRIQRLNRNDANCIELLEHFFRVCEKEDRLGMVLNLQLTPLEEEIFMNYLETSKHPKANDMRVIYFLMRTRIVEAISMNNKINGNGHKFDNSVRNLLVEAYAKTLPSVTQKLLHHCIQERKALSRWKQVDRPTPLSVVVRPGASQPVSYKSSLYLATLQKARETWMIPIAPPCTPVSKEKEKESSAIQFMPFLCTPQDGIREDVLSTSAILSSKRLQEEQGGTPKKRPCREVVAPPISSEVKLPRLSIVAEMLHSPRVERLTPPSRRKTPVSKNFALSSTPHSILKGREVRRSLTPESGLQTQIAATCQTPEVLDEIEEERTTAVRQIRFSLPKRRESYSDSPSDYVCRKSDSSSHPDSAAKQSDLSSPVDRSSKGSTSFTPSLQHRSYTPAAATALENSASSLLKEDSSRSPLPSPEGSIATANICLKSSPLKHTSPTSVSVNSSTLEALSSSTTSHRLAQNLSPDTSVQKSTDSTALSGHSPAPPVSTPAESSIHKRIYTRKSLLGGTPRQALRRSWVVLRSTEIKSVKPDRGDEGISIANMISNEVNNENSPESAVSYAKLEESTLDIEMSTDVETCLRQSTSTNHESVESEVNTISADESPSGHNLGEVKPRKPISRIEDESSTTLLSKSPPYFSHEASVVSSIHVETFKSTEIEDIEDSNVENNRKSRDSAGDSGIVEDNTDNKFAYKKINEQVILEEHSSEVLKTSDSLEKAKKFDYEIASPTSSKMEQIRGRKPISRLSSSLKTYILPQSDAKTCTDIHSVSFDSSSNVSYEKVALVKRPNDEQYCKDENSCDVTKDNYVTDGCFHFSSDISNKISGTSNNIVDEKVGAIDKCAELRKQELEAISDERNKSLSSESETEVPVVEGTKSKKVESNEGVIEINESGDECGQGIVKMTSPRSDVRKDVQKQSTEEVIILDSDTSKTSDDEQDVLEISPPLPDLLQNAKEVETGEWKLTTLVPVVIKEEQESVSNLEENRVLTDGLADDQKILMEVELIHTTDESRESVEIIEEPNMSASFDSVRSNYDMREESHRNDHDDSAAIGTTVDHNENDDSGKTKEKVHLIHLGKRKEISHEIGCEPNVITGNDDVEIGITARKEDEYINSIDRHNDQFKVGEETKNKVLSSVIESKESPTVKTKDNIYTERNEGVVQSKYPVVGIEQTLSPLRIEEICGTSADSASVERCSNVDLPEITCISDIAGEGQESMAVSIIQGGPHQNNSTEDSIGSLSSIHQGDLSASVEEIEMVQKITRTKKANLVENMSPEVEEVKTVQKVVTTRRGSRLQSHQDNLSNVSGVKETKTVEKITTTKKKSHSVVGEPPRMSDVEEIEETVGRAITRRKKSRSVQSEPPMLADVEEVKTVRRVVKTRKQLNQPEEGNVEEVKTMQKVVKTRKRLNSHTADIGTDSKVSVENPEPSTVVGDDILVNEDRVAVDSEKLANSNISEKESNIMLKRHLVEMETYKNESAIQSCSEEAEMPLETQPSFSELYQVEIESKAVKEGGVSMNVQPTASEPCQVDNKSETPAKKEMSMGSHPTASESCQADNESETPAKKEMSMGSHPTASESCQADNESETPAKKAEMSMSSHPTASESCQADNESETPAKKAEMSMDIQPAASELCQVDHESETPAKEAEMSMGSYPTASELCQADNESETAKEAEISMGSHPIFSESCQADNESETPAKKAEMSMDIQPTASESCQVNNESETPAKEAGTSIEMQPTVSESCKVNYESEVPAKEDEISMDMQPAAGESCQIDHASGSSAKEAEILMETQLVESGTCQVDSENETPPRKEEILKETLPTDGEICRFDYKSESAYPDATEINKIDHLHELEERTQNKKRTSKRKSGLIVENIELTKERLRPRQSSSIQSEPPALSDVDISVYDSSQQKSKVESTSIQSEPCDLADVSTMSDTSLNISLQRKTRSTKRSTSSAKKKITRSRSYRLSLREKPPIHLSDVLEVNESEIPSTAADHQNISVAEQGTKHVKTSGNEGKSDKYCSSISSKSTVEYKIDVDERKDGKAKSSECIEIIDSPHSSNSLSSKSTVEYIAGMSEDEKLNQKRDASSGSVPVSNKMEQTFEAEKKQSRSSSKTEAPHQVLSPAPGNSSQPDDENSHRDQMAEYASTRRLTRHQRSLMSRSMGVHKASHKTRRTSSRLDASTQEEDSVDSNEESEVSSIATRSSVKLLEHRKLSPSSGSQLSVLKESSQSPKSVGRMSSKSRTSQRSRRSVRRDARLGTPSPARSEASMASSMASSQSQALHSPGSSQSGYASKPRRRSFQRAQQALVSSPVPKIVHSKDHSESESVGDGSVNEEDTIGSNVHRRRSHRRSLLLPSVQEENNPESDGEADITDSESIVSVGSRQTRSSVQQMQKTKDSSDKGKELFSFSSPLQVSKNFKEETGSALGFVFSPPETHVLRKTRSSHISEHPSSLQTITEESSSNSSKTSSKTSTSKHKNHKDSDESGGKSEQSSPSSSPVKKKLTSSPSKTTPKKRKSTPQSLKEKYSKLRRKSVSKTSPRRPRGVFFTPLPEEEKRLAKERQSNVSRKSTAHKFHSAFKSRTSFSLKRKTK